MLLFLSITGVWASPTFEQVRLELNQRGYLLEIADTPALRQRGLMFREALASDQGMLFVYQKPGNNRIWMKNTLIPLTVLWLDSNARVIHRALLQPCKADPCPVESAGKPSLYIVELSEDNFSRFQKGDQLVSVLQWASRQ